MRSARAAYWRVIALDWFTDDNAWGVNKATEHSASTLTAPDDLPPSIALHQQFDIERDRPALAPGRVPAGRDQPDGRARRARLAHAARRLDAADRQGRLRRAVAGPDAVRNDAEGRAARPRPMPQDLELPSDFPQSVRNLAEQITAGTATALRPRGRAPSTSSASPATSPTRSTPTSTTRPTPSCSSSTSDAGLLRAIRRDVRGHGACGAACRLACRRRVPAGHTGRRRPLPRHEPQRARVAGGVDRRRGLDPVRADAGVPRADARPRDRRTAAAAAQPPGRDDDRPPARRRQSRCTFPTVSPTLPGRRGATCCRRPEGAPSQRARPR